MCSTVKRDYGAGSVHPIDGKGMVSFPFAVHLGGSDLGPIY